MHRHARIALVAVLLAPLAAVADGTQRQREVEKQIRAGTLHPSITAEYDCNDKSGHLTAAFYNNADPRAVSLAFGDDQTPVSIAFIAMSGSGSRYTGENVEYWEHQGVAVVTIDGRKLTCKPLR
jgi:uncharacterized protein